jgi:hypothetical protein
MSSSTSSTPTSDSVAAAEGAAARDGAAPPSRHAWQVVTGSVAGAAHDRTKGANQDAIQCAADAGSSQQPPLVMAVSDGHGSPRSFRSDRGALFAVEVAVGFATRLLAKHQDAGTSQIRREAESSLPAEIVEAWRGKVMEDWRCNPPSDAEGAAGANGSMATDDEASRVPIVYGATLLLVAVGEGFAFYLQLGDGEILVACESNGEVPIEVHHPLPPDSRLIANETTSLCLPEAATMFRFAFREFDEQLPALILAATDGYPNSFSTPADFERVASDLLPIFVQQGAPYVRDHLREWLWEASRDGSGDDVTVGLIRRVAAAGAAELAIAEGGT